MLTVQLSLPSELGRKSNGTIPRMQPTATPTALPMFIAQRVDPLVICSGSKLGWGTPNLLAKVSIYQAEPIPATSEIKRCQYLTAIIIMKLSRKPKPTNGKA